MDSLYNFSIIAQDLRQEEYIIQIADSLQHITDVVDDIFRRIDRRIDENSSRTEDLVVRIAACRRGVERLADTNKATKIFSGAKYPAMNCYRNYRTVFDRADDDDVVVIERSENEIKSKIGMFDDAHLQEKLEFYHVKMACPNVYQWLQENQPNVGLGSIPSRVENVSSLLLFDGKQFAYGLEPAREGDRFHAMRDGSTDDKRGKFLDAAPFSISNRDQTSKKVGDSYLYSPGMGEVPMMDVPLDLPHLSGVAEDMQFSSETGPVIAPSAVTSHSVEDVKSSESVMSVPSVLILENPTGRITSVDAVEVQNVKSEEATVIDAPAAIEAATPPPPPPIGPLLTMTNTELSNVNSGSERKSNSASIAHTEPISKSKPTAALDNRAGLMEAIRKAGGSGKAKLRSTVETPKKEEKKATGGDLMADLHAKLSMRRKGISGDRGKTADGSILDVISAMIPPPTSKSVDQSSYAEASSAEEDWD